jgi:hypothetical protein
MFRVYYCTVLLVQARRFWLGQWPIIQIVASSVSLGLNWYRNTLVKAVEWSVNSL